MIIDGHAHASREFSTVETLKTTLDTLGVDKVVLCPSLKNNIKLGPPPKIFNNSAKERTVEKVYALNRFITLTYRLMRMNGDPNAYVYSLKEQLPERVEQAYWVDFRKAEAIDSLASDYYRWHFSSIKIHQGWNPHPFDSPLFLSLLEQAKHFSLPLFIHPGTKKETCKLRTIAAEFPQVTFILAHLMGLEAFKGYGGENVFHDISPTNLRSSLIYDARKSHGYEHILFGSDTPFGNPATNLEKVRQLHIPSREKDAILGGNMAKVLAF